MDTIHPKSRPVPARFHVTAERHTSAPSRFPQIVSVRRITVGIPGHLPPKEQLIR
jgi:hypothetical protein